MKPMPPIKPHLRRAPYFRLHSAASIALAALLAGCVAVPAPLQGSFASVSPHSANASHLDVEVRWGGRIVGIENFGERNCIVLIAQPLGANGQPDGSDVSLGRFRACADEHYPTRSFAANREVTITGRIEGFYESEDGHARWPSLATRTVVLWPQRR